MYSARPFAGLTSEADIIAVREFVPSATAPLTLRDSDRTVLLCSLLPGAAPAMVREDGTIWLGLQVQHGYGDPSRDLGAVLLAALDAEPGTTVGLTTPPAEGPQLQDLIVDQPVEFTVHQGFDFWISDLEDSDGSLAAALEQANASAPHHRAGFRHPHGPAGPRSGSASTSAGCRPTTRTGYLTAWRACTSRATTLWSRVTG